MACVRAASSRRVASKASAVTSTSTSRQVLIGVHLRRVAVRRPSSSYTRSSGSG
jgi:hypothetical protein